DVQRQLLQRDRQAGAHQAATDDQHVMGSDHRHMIRGPSTDPRAPARPPAPASARAGAPLRPPPRRPGGPRPGAGPARLECLQFPFLTCTMTVSTQRAFILSVLVLLMAASRAHVFDHFSPPDASWAVFFIAGFHLRGWGRWVFPLLLALGVAVDWQVISRQGMDFWGHYCMSAGYWGLVPAYAAMWAGGAWLRRHYTGADWEALGRTAAALVAGAVLCHVLARVAFYWTSDVVAEPSLAGW